MGCTTPWKGVYPFWKCIHGSQVTKGKVSSLWVPAVKSAACLSFCVLLFRRWLQGWAGLDWTGLGEAVPIRMVLLRNSMVNWKPDKKSEHNNWSIFRPKCCGKPIWKSGIICLPESAIKVITFSIISYLFPIVQISYIAPICRVVSPIQKENNMQNIFWLWGRLEMMLK